MAEVELTASSRRFWAPALCFGLSLIAFALAVCCGSTSLSDNISPEEWQFILALRLPRAVLGYAAGAALAISGVAFQTLLHNPLADPYVMGVSAGASLGGTIAIIMAGGLIFTPLCAFGGALLTVFLAMWIAQKIDRGSPLTLLLTGVIINAFASSVITMLKVTVSATKAQELLFWLMGTLGYPDWQQAVLAIVTVLLASILLCTLSQRLNVLALGEDVALTSGVNVHRTKWLIYLLASLIVAVVVAQVGMIGFIGLVVPHMLRFIVGADHRLLLPCSFFAGAAILLLADTAGRLLFNLLDTTLPVGVITSFIGGPFFLWLLAHSRSLQK